jgi:hypothetical protein
MTSYCMLVEHEESLDLFAVVRQVRAPRGWILLLQLFTHRDVRLGTLWTHRADEVTLIRPLISRLAHDQEWSYLLVDEFRHSPVPRFCEM